MAAAGLPDNGSLRIGSLQLPEGCRTHVHGARDGSTPPVAWVTITPVPDPGAVWEELSGTGQRTGLVPFIARTLPGSPHRPWDNGGPRWPHAYFQYPADPAAADEIDPAAVLAARWASQAPDPADEEADPEWREAPGPRWRPSPATSPAWPPPAPGHPTRRRSAPPSPACRPPGSAWPPPAADALAAMGWRPGNWTGGVLPVTAVLRSWEDRFGARLLAVGHDEFKLLAERPPAGLPAARRLAAEIYALGADEFTCAWHEQALTSIGDIAGSLTRSPAWGLWWD
jgi:hypothetical protein